MAGEGVPEHVRGEPGGVEAGFGCERLQELGHALAGEMAAAAARGEEPLRARGVGHHALADLEPVFQRPARGAAHGHDALLLAFAAHPQPFAVGRDGREREGDQLGDPQAGGVEELEEGREPQRIRALVGAGGGDQRLDLLLAQEPRQRAGELRCVDVQGRLVLAAALEVEEAIILAQGG